MSISHHEEADKTNLDASEEVHLHDPHLERHSSVVTTVMCSPMIDGLK